MRTWKNIAFICALLLAFSAVAGCAAPAASTAPAAESASAAATPAEAAAAPEAAPAVVAATFDGTVTIGLQGCFTGENATNGEYQVRGFQLAVEEINAAGGVLGKEVKFVQGDEMSTAEGSVNAFNMLATNDEISVIAGTTQSVFIIACDEAIRSAKIPYVGMGSSSKVNALGNPYIYQTRPLDTAQGPAIAKVAAETLGMKNPAILYSTDSTYVSLMEQTVPALRDTYGLEIPASSLMAFAESESNFSSYIAKIQNGGYDGAITFSGQPPCILLMQQVQAAGLDINWVGSNSVGDVVTLGNAKDAGEGWYSIVDWSPTTPTEVGANFNKNYVARWSSEPGTASANAYDAMYIIKDAMEKAGTTSDRVAILKAFESIEYTGAASNYSYHTEDHSWASSVFLCVNKWDGEKCISQCQEIISYR